MLNILTTHTHPPHTHSYIHPPRTYPPSPHTSGHTSPVLILDLREPLLQLGGHSQTPVTTGSTYHSVVCTSPHKAP